MPMFSAKKIMSSLNTQNVDGTVPSTISFGPAPTIPGNISFGPSPTINGTSFTWGTAPLVKNASFVWGTPPDVSASFNWGTPPDPAVNWGEAPAPAVNWGEAPFISVSISQSTIANKTPTSSSASGNAGEVCWDANYVYVCVATNSWKRMAISSW